MKHTTINGSQFTETSMIMIWVTFQLEGFHQWKDAPEEVDYLRNVHRHMFHFKVGLEVFSNDREVEFHILKNFLLEMVGHDFSLTMNKEIGEGESCEKIAESVRDILQQEYGLRRALDIEVSEDGECGVSLKIIPIGENMGHE
jgi:hypothetical protein